MNQVFLNAQHSLLDSQVKLLDTRFPEGWEAVKIPAEGWNAVEMAKIVAILPINSKVAFVSPVPLLIGLTAAQALDNGWEVFVMHNDKRVAKEVKNMDGSTKIIHVIANEGWELIRVA